MDGGTHSFGTMHHGSPPTPPPNVSVCFDEEFRDASFIWELWEFTSPLSIKLLPFD